MAHPSSTSQNAGGFCAIERNSHIPIDKPTILCYSIIEKESDRTWRSPRSEENKSDPKAAPNLRVALCIFIPKENFIKIHGDASYLNSFVDL